MKVFKFITGLGVLFLCSISFSASAQTPVCTWGGVNGGTTGGTSWMASYCKDKYGRIIARRTDTIPPIKCGTATLASTRYVNTGIKLGTTFPAMCDEIITYAPGTQACSSGFSIFLQSHHPFNAEYYCGPQPLCKYKSAPYSPHPFMPGLKYTCL